MVACTSRCQGTVQFDGIAVRRLLLEKTRCHVYDVILERESLVRIVAVWGATRGAEPGALGR
jgi:hypothetical protein